jgi:hypothetical protein
VTQRYAKKAQSGTEFIFCETLRFSVILRGIIKVEDEVEKEEVRGEKRAINLAI